MTAQEVLALVGPATLLNVARKTKRPILDEWQTLRIEDMTPEYLANLNHQNNIGVSLGVASGGLCVIDIDNKEGAQQFAAALKNTLGHTLISRGARGASFWFHLQGEFPASCDIKTKDGPKWAEWRATGRQSVISGEHPSGNIYCVNGRKPIQTTLDKIPWPEGCRTPLDKTRARGRAAPASPRH